MGQSKNYNSSVKNVLSHGYLHSNKGNFVRNYNELASDAKYSSAVQRFYEVTKNMSDKVLKVIEPKASANKEVLQSLININTQDILNEGNKLLSNLELSFKGNEDIGSIKMTEQVAAGQFADYMNRLQKIFDVASSGSIDSQTLQKLSELYKELKDFADTGSYINPKTQKVRNSLDVTVITGTLFEYLEKLIGIAARKQLQIESTGSQDYKQLTFYNADKTKKYNIQISGMFATSDFIVRGISDDGKTVSIPLGVQVKYQMDQHIRGEFGKSSWGWGSESWQNFYIFLVYIVNNIQVFKSKSPLKDEVWTQYTDKLTKSLIVRGVIQALITSKTNAGNKVDEMVDIAPDLMNVFSIIGGSGKKIKIFSNAELLRSVLSELNFDNNNSLDKNVTWAYFDEFHSFTDYINSIKPTYANDLYRFTRAKLALSSMLGERAGDDFYSYVVGQKSVYKTAKVTRKKAVEELKNLIKDNKMTKNTNALPSDIWKSLSGKYWFFGTNRKNNIDLRFDITHFYND